MINGIVNGQIIDVDIVSAFDGVRISFDVYFCGYQTNLNLSIDCLQKLMEVCNKELFSDVSESFVRVIVEDNYVLGIKHIMYDSIELIFKDFKV